MPNEGMFVAKRLLLSWNFVNIECLHSKFKICCEFFYDADLKSMLVIRISNVTVSAFAIFSPFHLWSPPFTVHANILIPFLSYIN